MDSKRWQKIQDIFEAVVELPEPKREVYLAKTCAGDSGLLDEIKAMLAADGTENNLLLRTIWVP